MRFSCILTTQVHENLWVLGQIKCACLLCRAQTILAPFPCRCKQEMEEDRSHEEHASLLRDVGDQPLAEGGFLELTWCVAHIDDQTVDL